jgi:hypothetical protein
MAELHKTLQKTAGGRLVKGVFGQKTFDELHPIGTSLVQQDNAAKAAEQAATDAAAQPAIPLPDEEELARIRRRRAARRTGGRDSTILAGDDTLGAG